MREVERVELVGGFEHGAGVVLVAALRVEQPSPLRGAVHHGARSIATLYIAAARGYCRIAPSCSATSKYAVALSGSIFSTCSSISSVLSSSSCSAYVAGEQAERFEVLRLRRRARAASGALRVLRPALLEQVAGFEQVGDGRVRDRPCGSRRSPSSAPSKLNVSSAISPSSRSASTSLRVGRPARPSAPRTACLVVVVREEVLGRRDVGGPVAAVDHVVRRDEHVRAARCAGRVVRGTPRSASPSGRSPGRSS